jgi:hypothetical protein
LCYWIDTWVADTNKPYLPILQKRYQIEEEKFRNSQLENVKFAELESLLGAAGTGTPVILTDEIMVGKMFLKT